MAQIFLMGTSGIGKTTLAEYISKRYRIPFIEGSSKVLWRKYNISSHKELLELSPEILYEFQLELLYLRIEIIRENKDFVSDRSVVDNMVYFLLQNAHLLGDDSVNEYIKLCGEYAKESKNPKYIYLSHELSDPKKFQLENDGFRINSLNYQNNVVGPIFDNVIKKNMLGVLNTNNFRMVRVYDWEERIQIVDSFLNDGSDITKTNLLQWIRRKVPQGNPCL